jgi:hypothetical protein
MDSPDIDSKPSDYPVLLGPHRHDDDIEPNEDAQAAAKAIVASLKPMTEWTDDDIDRALDLSDHPEVWDAVQRMSLRHESPFVLSADTVIRPAGSRGAAMPRKTPAHIPDWVWADASYFESLNSVPGRVTYPDTLSPGPFYFRIGPSRRPSREGIGLNLKFEDNEYHREVFWSDGGWPYAYEPMGKVQLLDGELRFIARGGIPVVIRPLRPSDAHLLALCEIPVSEGMTVREIAQRFIDKCG